MRHEEIEQSIKGSKNTFEEEKRILTIKVVRWRWISEQVYLYLGFKKEEKGITATMFVAFRKGKKGDNWDWMCPSKETCEELGSKIKSSYHFVNRLNEDVRKGKGILDIDNPLRLIKEKKNANG